MTKLNVRSLFARFPTFAKPSYETFVHKKVEKEYDICMAIPSGKRAFLWFTFYNHEKTCFIIELGRHQELQDNIHILPWNFDKSFALGTLLSGYLVDGDEKCPNHKYFIGDEIFMFKGYEFGNPFPIVMVKKYEAFCDFFDSLKTKQYGNYSIHCIVMWNRSESETLPERWAMAMGYNMKHIQYRCSRNVQPYVNYILNKNPWAMGGPNIQEDAMDYVPRMNIWSDVTKYKKQMPLWNIDVHSPIFRRKTLFWVQADISYDVYYLYVQNNVLYQYAFVPNYKTSVMMNGIFRHIVENKNIDYIEESEDEAEFENIRDDKYVDLEKRVLMECGFDRKFKKWIPLRIAHEQNRDKVPLIDDFIVQNHTKSNGHIYDSRRPKPQFNQSSKHVPFHRRGHQEKGPKKQGFQKRQKEGGPKNA